MVKGNISDQEISIIQHIASVHVDIYTEIYSNEEDMGTVYGTLEKAGFTPSAQEAAFQISSRIQLLEDINSNPELLFALDENIRYLFELYMLNYADEFKMADRLMIPILFYKLQLTEFISEHLN